MNMFNEIAKSIARLTVMDPEKYSYCRMELQKEAETRGEAFLRFVDTLLSVADDMRNHA